MNNVGNTNQGNINLAAGSTLQIGSTDALQLNTGTSFAGSTGTLDIAGGSVDVATVVDLSGVAMTLSMSTNSALSNAQNLTIPNTFNFNGGTLSGLGTFTTPVGSTVVMDAPILQDIDWVNQGTVNWLPTDSSFVDWTMNSASFTNQGTLLLQNVNALSSILNTGGSSITNDVTGIINANPTSSLSVLVPLINFGTIDLNSGTLSLGGSDLTLGGGSLIGVGTFSGNVIADSGSTIAAGLSPGTLSITGNVDFQSGSNFDVELQSTTPGEFDVLNVSGNVTVDGANLNIIGFGGYTGNIGNSFQVLTAGGTFTSTADFIVSDDFNFKATPFYTLGSAGDLTLDVTSLFNFWLSGSGNWNANPATDWSQGILPDANHDVVIDNGTLSISYAESLTTINLK